MSAHLSDQLLVTSVVTRLHLACGSLKRPTSRNYWVCSLTARLSEHSSALSKKVTGSNPFSPKIPNFDLPNTQTRPKSCLQVYEHNEPLKVTQNLKTKHHYIIIQQFNKFHQNLQQHSNFSSPIHKYEYPMHQFIKNTSHNNNNNI